ncbi:flagellar biosynthesis repressor FlbT [Aquabacter sp. CN5-332]|uniref:flagellar biosynthesis repressor FlbT n=1 Tax=Aquabacter sp. CN5-332 TaxID=3156608 RepID=UPI0032B5A0B7
MTKRMQISLKPGERIFLNGAVVRVDRKVTLELMNDVAFLLESHVLQMEDTTTPLRQLYFAVQTMLMAPRDAEAAYVLFGQQLSSLIGVFENKAMLTSLLQVGTLVDQNRLFEALRIIRSLFPVEDQIINSDSAASLNPVPRIDAAPPLMEITL